MAPARPGAFDPIQVDGVFILGSPMPLNIRKLSEEYEAHKQENGRRSPARQMQPPALPTMREDDDQPAQKWPPRTSSSPQGQEQRPRANTDYAMGSVTSYITRATDESYPPAGLYLPLGNFTDLGTANDTLPTASDSNRERVHVQEAPSITSSGRNRERVHIQEAPSITSSGRNRKRIDKQETAAHYQRGGQNPYEYEEESRYDETHERRLTNVQDFLDYKFGKDDTSRNDNTPTRNVARHPVMVTQGAGPFVVGSTVHVKNSASESNPNYTRRSAPRNYNTGSKPIADRGEYQQELPQHYYGLQRSRSSPQLGAPSHSAPSRAVEAYAAYENYEDEDRDPDPYSHSGQEYLRDERAATATPTRGRHSRPTGLGVENVQLQNAPEDSNILQDPFPVRKRSSSPTKRSRSPFKRMFGPGGFLGNTGALQSPADARYVKPKPSMLTKLKTTFENLAEEIPRSLSPIKNAFKIEEKPGPSKFPVSLSPPRQAKLYMEFELLICATTNKFLMDQYRSGRMTTDSLKRISEFWKSKGRPQVIEFQYDQATQRDLVVLNQRNFQFNGAGANNLLQVNAMLHSWKENAREMAVRTFCMPDTVIQKQLHDAYKLLELFGAPVTTFFALHEIHNNFNRYVKKTEDNREKIATMKPANEVETRVVPPRSPPMEQLRSRQRIDASRDMTSSPQNTGPRDKKFVHRTNSPTDQYRAYDPADLYPFENSRPRNGPAVTRTNGYHNDPYPDQSNVDDYYPPRAPFHDQVRPRAGTESRGQRDSHDSNTPLPSRVAEFRKKHDHQDSAPSTYSSGVSGSRTRIDHPESVSSWTSKVSSSRSNLDSVRNQHYRQDPGSASHSARNQNERSNYGHSDSYDAPGPRANTDRRDGATPSRGEASTNARSNNGATQRHGRFHEEFSQDGSFDDLSVYGKYAAGL